LKNAEEYAFPHLNIKDKTIFVPNAEEVNNYPENPDNIKLIGQKAIP